MTDQRYMALAAGALFTYDSAGRMLRVNELDGDLAPRFLLCRTTSGNFWRFGQHTPPDVIEQLEALCRREPIAPNFDALRNPPQHIDAFLQTLAPATTPSHGPEFRFPEPITSPENMTVTRITHEDEARIAPHFAWMLPLLDVMPPAWAVEQDGKFVAACFSSRTTAQADEAGVFVAEGYRGRGFAPAVVAAWAMGIRALGRVPLYSTAWDNVASQRVAAKLELIPIGAMMQIE
jgi:RimJ/RimL family protein N-acetyltransferase